MPASGKASTKLSRLAAPLLLALVIPLLLAPPALAASPLKVREVFPGSAAAGVAAEYVELQMTADGQNLIAGQQLRFYDAAGNESSTFLIPADVANGQSQRTVLLGTQEATEDLPGLSAVDFDLGAGSDRMNPAGGAVCLTGALPADCVTWGSIPLATIFDEYLPDGQAANAVAIADGLSLHRDISRGCATYLETADDTASSAADFDPGAPAPVDNSATPTETRCPPDTALLTFPPNPSGQASASFTYAETPAEAGASFECSLDGGGFAPCPEGGVSYPGPLADGSHSFAVRAIGEGGEDPSPKSFAWTIDTAAPETAIDSFPPEPSGGFSAAFSYGSSEPQSSFRCQLDSGAVQSCPAAGKTYFLLTDGAHAFRVWAIDNAGNQDPTPAEHSFTVTGVLIDQSPPDTAITAGPTDPTQSTASFVYSSSEQGSSFECRLGAGAFSPCPAVGKGYGPLRNGGYTFEVRAIDRAGNVDSVPATYAWNVRAPLPRVSFTRPPGGSVRLERGTGAKLRFSFKADRPGSTFRCRLDTGRFTPCTSPLKVRAGIGRHRFEVYAIDSLGNEGTARAKRIFRVQAQRAGGLF